MFLIQIVFLMVQQVNVLTGRMGEVLTPFVKMTISSQIIIKKTPKLFQSCHNNDFMQACGKFFAEMFTKCNQVLRTRLSIL